LREQLNTDEQPFFAYLHYIDPHDPYAPPRSARNKFTKPYNGWGFVKKGNPMPIGKMLMKLRPEFPVSDRDIEHLIDLYDEEISYFDQHFGALLALLEEKNRYRNTIVILLSDHGEEFKEHNLIGHCGNVYETLIHTPLIVRLADLGESGTRSQLTQNLDIVPTLLDYLGIDSSSYELHGKSLRPAIENESEIHADVHSSQTHYRTIADHQYKLIRSLKLQTKQLFDMQADRDENKDIASNQPGLVDRYSARLDEWIEQSQPKANDEIIEAERRAEDQLRALGYIP
jgi:arylsulfatase A-like enzyme